MKLFHVDRQRCLREGNTLYLTKYYPVNGYYGRQVSEYVSELYPDGISEHGLRYLFDGNNPNWVYEAHLENMRLRSFPKSLSRFQSFLPYSLNAWILS